MTKETEKRDIGAYEQAGLPWTQDFVGGLFGLRTDQDILWNLPVGTVREKVIVNLNPPAFGNIHFAQWLSDDESVGHFRLHVGVAALMGGKVEVRMMIRDSSNETRELTYEDAGPVRLEPADIFPSGTRSLKNFTKGFEGITLAIDKAIAKDPSFEKQLIKNIEQFVKAEYKDFSFEGQSLKKSYPATPQRGRGPEVIVARAFWWGFHFDVPHQAVLDIETAINTGAGIAGLFAGITGPAAPFVALAVSVISAGFAFMKSFDRGNGIYISMSWFAAGIFVPTTR